MRSIRLGLVLMSAVIVGSGCASSEQWTEWKAHSTHFASGEHLTFSAKNQGDTPRVYRRDQRMAASQSWWGDPVVVRPDQIFGD